MIIKRFPFELIKVEGRPGLSFYPYQEDFGCEASKDFLMELKNMLVSLISQYEGKERTKLENLVELIIEEIVINESQK
ncbi:MAG: hypothetical protein JSV96_17820 [Candidatus Aminicenantes bacterium]|nr:MAG: hypothetical protein JSV96_17820 [Candidatus Aminicenantes bacterium]